MSEIPEKWWPEKLWIGGDKDRPWLLWYRQPHPAHIESRPYVPEQRALQAEAAVVLREEERCDALERAETAEQGEKGRIKVLNVQEEEPIYSPDSDPPVFIPIRLTVDRSDGVYPGEYLVPAFELDSLRSSLKEEIERLRRVAAQADDLDLTAEEEGWCDAHGAVADSLANLTPQAQGGD